jgi:hypothetical protein
MSVHLYGYQYSVYAWIARLAMHEKGIGYTWVEINPFARDVPADYLAMHPFGRVPTLINGVLYFSKPAPSHDTSMKHSRDGGSSRSTRKTVEE